MGAIRILISFFLFSHFGFADRIERFDYRGYFTAYEQSDNCDDVFPAGRFYASASIDRKEGRFNLFFSPVLGVKSPETWWNVSFHKATISGGFTFFHVKEEKTIVVGPDKVEYEVSYDGWLDAGGINIKMEIEKRDPSTHKKICRVTGSYQG